MKKIEDNNTLVFIVDTRANKKQIKAAVGRLYDIQVWGWGCRGWWLRRGVVAATAPQRGLECCVHFNRTADQEGEHPHPA